MSDLQQAGAAPPPAEPSAPVPPVEGRGQVERILRLFCEKARQDAALSAFAAKRRVITHYTLTDLGLEFYVGFREGRVVADVGAPPEPAEVRMKATAETLDGILTGRVSGTKAAMSGKLAFSGDVRVAMGLQRVQGDLVRLYTAAREEAGGIDFSTPVGRPAGGPSGLPEAAEDPRPEMVRVIEELYRLGLITATGGNVSVRIPGREECWITPSQLYKGDLRPEMMVRIDLAGNVLDEGAPAPSSERAVHTELYRARPEAGAIIHAHAPYATILALCGLPFLPVTTEAAFFGKVPVVPFVMPGTKELAQAVVKAMGKSPACILQNHGVVVVAGSLRRAANLVEMLERTAQLLLGCYAVGKRPAVLPKEVARMLGEMEVS
ncbi:MAG: class II aldolase/adducin family protein [Chloroflexia bacterium]